MKVKRVEIDNCFNLKSLKLDLEDGCTLIVGPNGSGKTNIIKCITSTVKQLTACSETDLKKPENKRNDEESTIKLHFHLSSEEILTVLEMRLWCVLSNCCTLLEQTRHEQDSSDKKNNFLTNVLPKLYEMMEEENEMYNSGTTLTVKWTRSSDQVIIELDETKLPDFRAKEKALIENELKDCREGFNFKIQSAGKDLVTKNLSEALDYILDHKTFLETERQSSAETWFPVGITPSELPCQGIKYLKQLQEVREIFGDKEFSLDTLVAHFVQTSVCIVNAQSRGSLPTECGSLFWDESKVEEKLVNASPSLQLDNFKIAMRDIGNLEFKVAKRETTFRRSPHCVMLKKCHVGNNCWEPLPSCSQGERDLLVILSAYYLSGSDNVILDEPGESFHPSQRILQFLDRTKDKVLLATTHSVKMISPQWKTNLYHMHENGPNYTASLVDSGTMDMLIASKMCQILFLSGVIFVEGINDQLVLNAFREVKLENGATATQSNGWDIIPMGGNKNWVKPYVVAGRLGIPYVIVFDNDVLSTLKKTMTRAPSELSDFKEEFDSVDPSQVQNISKKYNICIWNSDLEKTLLCKEVTDKLEMNADIMCKLAAIFPNVVILPVQESCESPRQPPPDSALVEEQRTPSSGIDDVDSQILNTTSNTPPVQESRESPGQPPPDSALVKEQLLSLKEYVNHPTKVKKLPEEFKQKSTATGNTIKRAPGTEMSDTTKDPGKPTNKLIQLSNTRAGDKSMWDIIRRRLHSGMWKRLSFETLKKIIMAAIEVQNHPFNELWDYLTKKGGSVIREIPQTGDVAALPHTQETV